MRQILLAGGGVVVAAIAVGLLIAVFQGTSLLAPRTITWSSPTPSPLPTSTPPPTAVPTRPPTLTPTQPPPTYTPTPTVHSILYSVQPGDTWASIAAQFGVKPEDILKANNLPAGSILYPGQVLVIPAPKTTPTPAPTWTPTPTGPVTP